MPYASDGVKWVIHYVSTIFVKEKQLINCSLTVLFISLFKLSEFLYSLWQANTLHAIEASTPWVCVRLPC